MMHACCAHHIIFKSYCIHTGFAVSSLGAICSVLAVSPALNTLVTLPTARLTNLKTMICFFQIDETSCCCASRLPQ
jgi:hypothetical protein